YLYVVLARLPPSSPLLPYTTLFRSEWYLRTHLGYTPDAAADAALADIFRLLAQRAAAQPRVLVHRDFHSPNLMLGPDEPDPAPRSEEHTSELQSRENLVCRLLLEKK